MKSLLLLLLLESLAGRWTATVQGQTFTLDLAADGSAELAGQRGRWYERGSTVVLVGADGVENHGRREPGGLVFDYQGVRIVFTRAAAAQPAPTPAPTPAPRPESKPEPPVPGKKVTPKGSKMSFVVPKGWKHEWAQHQGMPAYQLMPPGELRGGIWVGSMTLGPAEVALPVPQLLVKGANQLLGQATARPIVGPEALQVGPRRGGRLVLETTAANGKAIEGYLGLVIVEDTAYIVLGIYPSTERDTFRPAANTVLTTFTGEPPPRNTALEQQVAGCWETFSGHSNAGGSRSSETRLRMDGRGAYDRRFTSSFSVQNGSGASDTHEAGRYKIVGTQVTFIPREGDIWTSSVSLKGRMLWLGKTEYMPCSN